MMLPLFALTGVANAMVNPMVDSLIGTHIPADRRTSAMGYTIAGLALIYLLAGLSTAYLSSLVDWRIVLLLIVAPITILNVGLTLYLVPSVKGEIKGASMSSLLSGYRVGLRNRSVLACLVGTFLGLTTWSSILVYGVTFVRNVFGVSTALASQLMILYSMSYIIGSLLTSRFAKKLGRRMLSVGTLTMLAVFTILSMNVSNLVFVIGSTILASFAAGMMITGTKSLTLDQLPLYRGTVMSLQSAAMSTGAMVAAIVGGIVITSIGFGSYGLLVGFFGFLASIMFYFFSVDPK
jgi:DHA1 family inner membrane transport protein